MHGNGTLRPYCLIEGQKCSDKKEQKMRKGLTNIFGSEKLLKEKKVEKELVTQSALISRSIFHRNFLEIIIFSQAAVILGNFQYSNNF